MDPRRPSPPAKGTRPAPAAAGAGRGPQGAGAAPGGARPQAPPAAAWESRFRQLEASIEQFRIDSERYFNGGLELPPEELRDRIARGLRELQGVQVRGAVDPFRLGGLEARFASLAELFGRRLRAREEGRGTPAPRFATEAKRHDAVAGVVLDGTGDGAAVEALWRRLASAGGRTLELETFRGYLAKQIGEIRARTGAGAVQFRVVEEEGKLKLKAKPLLAGEE